MNFIAVMHQSNINHHFKLILNNIFREYANNLTTNGHFDEKWQCGKIYDTIMTK
jgi:hypothetical protein